MKIEIIKENDLFERYLYCFDQQWTLHCNDLIVYIYYKKTYAHILQPNDMSLVINLVFVFKLPHFNLGFYTHKKKKKNTLHLQKSNYFPTNVILDN